MKISDEQVWNTCGYVRLSREDGDKEESNSVTGQKDLIRDEFAAGVYIGCHLFHFTQRNAASIVAHHDFPLFCEGDVNAFSGTHVEFIYGVVNNLFDKYIYAIVGVGSVSELADIHAGTPADMLVPFQSLDGIVIVGAGI